MASKWFSFAPPTVNRLVHLRFKTPFVLFFSEGKFISHSGQAINALGQGRPTSFYSSDESAPGWNSRDPRFGTGVRHPIVDEAMPLVSSVSGHTKYVPFTEENRVQNPVAALKDYVRALLLVCWFGISTDF